MWILSRVCFLVSFHHLFGWTRKADFVAIKVLRGIEQHPPPVVEKGNTWIHLPVGRGMLRLRPVARLESTPV